VSARALGISGQTWDERTPEENALVLAELDLGVLLVDAYLRRLGQSPHPKPEALCDGLYTPSLEEALRVLEHSRYLDRMLTTPQAEAERREVRDDTCVL
jgi:hypothetical protein